MKRVWVIGKKEECEIVCGIFRAVNADACAYQGTESLLTAGRMNLPHLVVVAYEVVSKSDQAIQEIRKDANLKSVPVLACYPAYTVRAEMRGRLAGADEVLILPLERRDLLSKAASLLHIEKRRSFRTMLTVEGLGRSVIGKSQDFSTSGLSFVADPSLKENEEVQIHLFLPGSGGRMRLNAMIARKAMHADGECLYGARFGANDQMLLDRIADFIDRGK